jgi:uncharacterized damage-inducible protein DinB
MSIAANLLRELEQEMPVTRKLLERVPDEKADWKPHEKSFSLAHLAQLVATMPGWVVGMLQDDQIDLARGAGYSNETTATLLARFDGCVEKARAALNAAKDGDLDAPWSLKHGDHTLFTMPRGQVLRMHMNHMVHHRAQLGVYLRLLDVPVPKMYGPTADERW